MGSAWFSFPGRTRTVRDSLLEDFKTLAAQEGLGDDTITIKEDKGTHTYNSTYAWYEQEHLWKCHLAAMQYEINHEAT